MSGCYQTAIGAHQQRTWEWNKRPLASPIRHISDWFRGAGYFTCNLQPANARGGLHGAAGSGKVDLNFFRGDPERQKFFDGSDWTQRKPGQPFFAHITIIETHKGGGWKVARQQPKSELVDPEKLKLAAYYPDSPIARDEYANYLDAIHLSDLDRKVARQQPKSELVDPEKLKLAAYYPDSPIARDEYANYLDAIHLSDGYVGQL